MKMYLSPNIIQTQSQINVAIKYIKTFQAQGCFQEALNICLQTTRTHPRIAKLWVNAATSSLLLQHWQEAIKYAQMALTMDVLDENDVFAANATLAHTYGILRQSNKARRYGLRALTARARQFNEEPIVQLWKLGPLPSLPSAQTREHNIIAFSLFGHDSKYCETAVLNAQDQPGVYPHWVCRFYVDSSVPANIIERLQKCRAQIVQVEGSAAQWPGTMWRFLALDDPQVHRILFRDADSVISQREAHAVNQWLTSGKRFHMMRDSCTHTELLMAGLWGVVNGSLPPLQELMRYFMNVPIESAYFADQRFLRQYVWPYARSSLMQHDSVFGFMDAIPFPDEEKPYDDFHVGCGNYWPFTAKVNLPNGSEWTWALFQIQKRADGRIWKRQVCSYTNTVQDGMVKAYIPRRYAQWIRQGTARIGTVESRSA